MPHNRPCLPIHRVHLENLREPRVHGTIRQPVHRRPHGHRIEGLGIHGDCFVGFLDRLLRIAVLQRHVRNQFLRFVHFGIGFQRLLRNIRRLAIEVLRRQPRHREHRRRILFIECESLFEQVPGIAVLLVLQVQIPHPDLDCRILRTLLHRQLERLVGLLLVAQIPEALAAQRRIRRLCQRRIASTSLLGPAIMDVLLAIGQRLSANCGDGQTSKEHQTEAHLSNSS